MCVNARCKASRGENRKDGRTICETEIVSHGDGQRQGNSIFQVAYSQTILILEEKSLMALTLKTENQIQIVYYSRFLIFGH
jgi:hypothetical protein